MNMTEYSKFQHDITAVVSLQTEDPTIFNTPFGRKDPYHDEAWQGGPRINFGAGNCQGNRCPSGASYVELHPKAPLPF